ncbi:MAG: hypothetical protein WCA90_06695, partial [Ilumatobacteraceae bacterium]
MGIALVSVTSFYLHGLIELSLLVVISPLVIVEPGLFGPVRDFVCATTLQPVRVSAFQWSTSKQTCCCSAAAASLWPSRVRNTTLCSYHLKLT